MVNAVHKVHYNHCFFSPAKIEDIIFMSYILTFYHFYVKSSLPRSSTSTQTMKRDSFCIFATNTYHILCTEMESLIKYSGLIRNQRFTATLCRTN